MVWCGSWCIRVLSVVRSETHPTVWCGGLIWGGSSYGLLMRSGSMAWSGRLTEEDGLVWRLKIRKMISWGNSSEKALNALGNYRKRNEEKIRKYFIYQIQLQLKTLISWKGSQRLNQFNTGLCWRFFRLFSICRKNRKLRCSSLWYQSRLGRNIFAQGRN